MTCPTCGGSDHRRSSSSKCKLRKKRARETSADEELETFAVKRCLRGFTCPLLDEDTRTRLLSLIERDVRDVSRFSIELSILVNHFYTTYLLRYDDRTFLEEFPKNGVDGLAALLTDSKRKSKVHDPHGVWDSFRKCGLGNTRYDATLRSYVLQHAVNAYVCRLETNVVTHAFSRIKRYLRLKISKREDTTDAQHAKRIHDACFTRFYKQSPSGDTEVDAWFDGVYPEPPTQNAVKKSFWRFVPLFRRIQAEIAAEWRTTEDEESHARRRTVRGSTRGISLFPQYKAGAKHVFYDSVALHQLLRRLDPKDIPSTWPAFNRSDPTTGEAGARAHWRRYFSCPPRFGYSMSTDGVSVTLTMVRPAKKRKEPPDKRSKTFTDVDLTKYVAVDPGAKLPLVTARFLDERRKSITTSTLSSGRVRFETAEYWREKARKKITKSVDDSVSGRGAPSPKTGKDPTEYTTWCAKHFESRQSVYEKRRLRRLRFDKYTRHQKFTDAVVSEYFPDRSCTVLYGGGAGFMNNARFRGHRKYAHDKLIAALRRRGRRVEIVDESYTTKRCSACALRSFARASSEQYDWSKSAPIVEVSKSPHRYVRCKSCRTGANRDKNGAINILIKSLAALLIVGSHGSWTDNKVHNRIPPHDLVE